MTSLSIRLPNVRKLFIPDPGFIIFDCDLDRADLQVVVWEADDEDLKSKLRMGVDLHIANGLDIEGKDVPVEELVPSHPEYPEHARRYARQRTFAKAFVHGTNYGGSARTMAANVGITVAQAEAAQKRWFAAHPGIKEWHNRTRDSLMTTRSVWNKFGFRRFYFDRIESCLPEALAWVPQSTVANVINIGLTRIHRELPLVQLLMQVHDSIVGQVHAEHFTSMLQKIQECLLVEIQYDDPLTIPVGIKASRKSWGECKDVEWDFKGVLM